MRENIFQEDQMKYLNSKLEHIHWGFDAILNAIYFRNTLEDNIDRCAFFYELNIGWYEMYHPDDTEERHL